jgi:phosphoglycerate dehydrogenase-like enzyme
MTRDATVRIMKLLVNGASELAQVPGLEEAAGLADIRFAPDESALKAELPGTEVLLGWNFRGRQLEDLWHFASDLRWIHWCGAGVDAVLFPDLVASDVVVTNARGIFDRAMAETVLGYMLAEVKLFRESWDLQGEHEWKYRMSDKLEGQSALIVGVGSIGHAVGSLLRAVGVSVIGVGRTPRRGDPVFGDIHGIADMNSLAAEVDWVIGVLPSTPQTRGVFDGALFEAMQPGARFINVGRGDAQDEAALTQALESGAIAGAMLDVFGEEPLPPGSPLWDVPTLFISPHISGDYHDYPADMVRMFIANLERFVAGESLENLVDKMHGYAAKT